MRHAPHGHFGRHLLRHLAAPFARHAMGRHQPGHGGSGMGGHGSFDGEGGLPRGRKFSSDDLQLLVLALLAEQPRHGYEIIKALEARSNGFYCPSPGMVYPALTYLEEIAYATVEANGNRKLYHIAAAGSEHLASNRERVELMLAKLTHIGRKMDLVRRAYAGEASEGAEERTGWVPEFIQSRRALKHALLLRTDAPADEQRRIAAILARATAEIEAGPAVSTE